MTKIMRFHVHRGIIMCPNCGNMPDYARAIEKTFGYDEVLRI
jgi:hypothetical protein